MLDKKITDSFVFRQGEPQYISRISRYGARGILLNAKKQIALMYMKNKGLYKLPGGGIDENETKEEAFTREVKEETGYHCHIISYLGSIEEHKLEKNFLHISYCFLAETVGKKGSLHLTKKEKSLGFKHQWFSIDEAIKMMEKSISSCNQYGMLFTLTRDKTILEYYKEEMDRDGDIA